MCKHNGHNEYFEHLEHFGHILTLFQRSNYPFLSFLNVAHYLLKLWRKNNYGANG
jgi:hypothetical protein